MVAARLKKEGEDAQQELVDYDKSCGGENVAENAHAFFSFFYKIGNAQFLKRELRCLLVERMRVRMDQKWSKQPKQISNGRTFAHSRRHYGPPLSSQPDNAPPLPPSLPHAWRIVSSAA